MRQKTIRGVYDRSKVQAIKCCRDNVVEVWLCTSDGDWSLLYLTPHQARILGKALIQMADEIQGKAD